MPHNNVRYPFEMHVLSWLSELADKILRGRGPGSAFVLVLRSPAGTLEPVVVDPTADLHRFLATLNESHTPHLWRDEFEPQEYTGFGWYGVERATMEGLMMRKLLDSDLVPFDGHSAGSREESEPLSSFPSEWSAVFG